MNVGFDAMVFDVDGVLLDATPSFTDCALQTARECAVPPGLGGGWGASEVETLRLAGGFNNDWEAATALALLGPATGPGEPWRRLCAALAEAGGGPKAVVAAMGHEAWDSLLPRVALRFQQLYAGRRAPEVYGVPPGPEEGLFSQERPLVDPQSLGATDLPFGLFTGRTWGETALGLERLGLSLPRDRVACDEGPRWRKPLPDGLLRLSESLGARRLLFVGDTVDDLEAAARARVLGLDVAFAGIAPPGSARAARFARGGAITVAPQVGLVLAWAKGKGRR